MRRRVRLDPAQDRAARRRAVTALLAFSLLGSVLVPAAVVTSVPASAEASATAEAVSVLTAAQVTPAQVTPAQVQAKQWWIKRLDLRKAWRITRGAGVTVAVLDTGVEGSFADLRGAIVPGFETDGGSGTGTVDDNPERHGTRIADEIAGRGTGFGLLGVAPQARILPVFVHQTEDATAEALNRLSAMAHPPQVVNMSYGTEAACPAAVQQAVSKAVAAGMILVAAAGNTNASGDEPNYPADCTGVVAAGAIDDNGHVWFESQRRSYVALAGPGVHMIGYYPRPPGFGYGDGTSDASAMVSATMALVRAKFPKLTSSEVVARVLATAHQFVGGPGTRNNSDGYGVALPYQALTQHVPADAPNPIYAALASAPSSGAATPPTQPTTQPTAAPSTQPSAPSSAAASASGGSSGHIGLIVGVAFAVIVIAFAIFLLLVRSRGRRRSTEGPSAGSWQ